MRNGDSNILVIITMIFFSDLNISFNFKAREECLTPITSYKLYLKTIFKAYSMTDI